MTEENEGYPTEALDEALSIGESEPENSRRKLKVVDFLKEEAEELENVLAEAVNLSIDDLKLDGRTFEVYQISNRTENFFTLELLSKSPSSEAEYIDQVEISFQHMRRVREV